MHIGFIGASGKVGRVALQNFYMNNEVEDVRLTLYSRHPLKNKGLLLDIEGMLAMSHSPFKKRMPIDIIATDDFSDLKDADVIIVSAGMWPSKEQFDNFKNIDNSGRMVQTYVNYELITDLSKNIAIHAPNSLVVIVTNQTDILSEVARQYLPAEKVLGFGGILDSSRFRTLLVKELKRKKEDGYCHNIYDEKAHVIGYHNNNMVPLTSTIPSFYTRSVIKRALIKTCQQGGEIARMQRDPSSGDVATGASCAPGYAVYRTMLALTGQSTIEESFNVVLSDETLSNNYGVPQGASLSVPVLLKLGGYEISQGYFVTSKERDLLSSANEMFLDEFKKLSVGMACLEGKNDILERTDVLAESVTLSDEKGELRC